MVIKSFKQFVKDLEAEGKAEKTTIPVIEEFFVTKDGREAALITEGKSYEGRFEDSIRVDNPTHGTGKRHAHLFARNGTEYGVVNVDGTPSHGSKMRVSDKDAEVLRGLGFAIPDDGIVEWIAVPDHLRFLAE